MQGPKLPIPVGNLLTWLGRLATISVAAVLTWLLSLSYLGWIIAAVLAVIVTISCFASHRFRDRLWAVLVETWNFQRWWG